MHNALRDMLAIVKTWMNHRIDRPKLYNCHINDILCSCTMIYLNFVVRCITLFDNSIIHLKCFIGNHGYFNCKSLNVFSKVFHRIFLRTYSCLSPCRLMIWAEFLCQKYYNWPLHFFCICTYESFVARINKHT